MKKVLGLIVVVSAALASADPSIAAATVPVDIVVSLDVAHAEVHQLHDGQAEIDVMVATGERDTKPGLQNLRLDHPEEEGQIFVGGVVVATGDWNGR